MKKAALVFALFLGTLALHAQTKISERKTKVIDSLLTYLYQNGRFMGSVNIRQDNKTLLKKAYGIIGEKNGKPLAANGDTRYRIGSISKTYTAVMIMQLVEEGKLSPDDHLQKFFPEIPNADKITIRQLLTHQSGLYNYTNDLQWRSQRQYVSQKDLIAVFAKQKPIFEPGAKTEYCNTNYMLLGYIVETITGKSFNDNLQSRIVRKLGLKHTLLPATNVNPAKNEALSFATDENGKWQAEPETHVSSCAGAGGVLATPEDVSIFLEALVENRLLKAATVQEMLPKQGENDINGVNSYGYGLLTMPFGTDHTAYGHSGHVDAFHTMSGYFAKDKLSMSLFANTEVMNLNQVAIYLLSILFDKAYTFPDFTEVAVSASDLQGLTGVYTTPQLPMEIRIMEHSGKLWTQATNQDSVRLTALSRDKFEVKEADLTLKFIRDEKGIAQQVLLAQGGEELKLKKKDPNAVKAAAVAVDEALLHSYEGVYSAASFPMKITISKQGTSITVQATGQPAILLTALSDTEFEFDRIGLNIRFKTNSEGKTSGLTLTQGDKIELTKE